MGIMKAIGASSREIARMYFAFVVTLAVLAMLIGTPFGIVGAGILARAIANSMNVELASVATPAWTFLVPAAVLTLTAVHAASTRILLAAQRSVRECLARNAAGQGIRDAPWREVADDAEAEGSRRCPESPSRSARAALRAEDIAALCYPTPSG